MKPCRKHSNACGSSFKPETVYQKPALSDRSRFFPALLAGLVLAMLFIAGCAHRPGAGGIKDNANGPWSGRISLQIQGESPQAFFAGFELQGQAEQGELTLTSPIGSVIAMLVTPGSGAGVGQSTHTL
jgi:hypothetical protein